jgi:hypothetical protein
MSSSAVAMLKNSVIELREFSPAWSSNRCSASPIHQAESELRDAEAGKFGERVSVRRRGGEPDEPIDDFVRNENAVAAFLLRSDEDNPRDGRLRNSLARTEQDDNRSRFRWHSPRDQRWLSSSLLVLGQLFSAKPGYKVMPPSTNSGRWRWSRRCSGQSGPSITSPVAQLPTIKLSPPFRTTYGTRPG